MLVDLLFALGTIGFLGADIRQLQKLFKVHDVGALSRTHLKLKMFSLLCVSCAYGITAYHVSLIISLSQFVLVAIMLLKTAKYKTEEEKIALKLSKEFKKFLKRNHKFLKALGDK
jgi:hypothetical protein